MYTNQETRYTNIDIHIHTYYIYINFNRCKRRYYIMTKLLGKYTTNAHERY